MKTRIHLFTILLLSLLTQRGFSQCDSTAFYAEKYLSSNYISDGQSYRALLFDDQVAEFNTTFYGGAKYRIVSFAGMDTGQLEFSLFDEDNNLLFTNSDYTNNPFWNFEFESTIKCKIEAKLDLTKQKSGCAVLLIGFER